MSRRTNTQTQQAHNVVPKSIKFGRVLLVIACVLFFIDVLLAFTQFALDTCSTVDPAFPYGQPIDWSSLTDVASWVILPISAFFMLFAGIGGINYVRDKGPFISWVSLAAILSGILFIIRILLAIASAFQGGISYNLADFTDIISLLTDFQISTVLYFFGWMLAKNWLD